MAHPNPATLGPAAERARDPYVVRIAALPVETVQQLRFERCWASIGELRSKQRWLAGTGEKLAGQLHPVIGELTTLKPTVVALRRALYGCRPMKERFWNDTTRAVLPDGLPEQIEQWQEKLAERDKLLAALPDLFAAEHTQAVRRLRVAVEQPAFRYGLVQGSPVLLEELAKWLDAPGDIVPDRQVLLRLVKYLTRVATKTSPYSTFTVVGMGAWEPGAGPPIGATGDWDWRSVVELNVWLTQRFSHLTVQQLRWTASPPGYPEGLRLRRNPSLVEDGASVRFLGAGTGSPLTTIGRGAALAQCLDLVAAKPVTVSDMCAHLHRIDPQLGDAEVAAFVGRLVDVGVLQLESPIADQEADHLNAMLGWLDTTAMPSLQGIRDTLGLVAGELAAFPSATDPATRLAAHHRIYAALAELNQTVAGTDTERLPRKNLYHENAVFTRPAVACARQAWQPIVDDLSALRGMLSLLDSTIPIRRALAEVFVAAYPDLAPVPWLLFYQHINRLVAGGRAAVCGNVDGETLRMLSGGPVTASWEAWSSLPYASQYAQAMAAATELVRGAQPGPDGVVRIDPDELARLAGHRSTYDGSLACYLQLTGDDPATAVVNMIGAGYGRGTTRVARLLEAAGASGTPAWRPYRHGPAGQLMAESSSTFASNLNLRAQGTWHELDVPFSNPSGDPDTRIPLGDLQVGYDPEDGLLHLQSAKDGRRVLPVHTGLMGELWLPGPVHHLVTCFGPPAQLVHSAIPLFFPRNGDPARDGAVRALPRLDAGRVTLSRACWAIAARAIPARRSGEHDAAYWLRLADWLTDQGVPERFYVKVVNPMADEPEWGPQTKARKPMYVDLAAWHLVRLFERTVGEGGELAVLTEALPTLDQAPRYGDGRHITELLIELPGKAGEATP
ncbi:hypothetical protein Rhe02_34330 [Rhizocola hellebori]|uniref:Lantibiotic dehydratase N-terminal domain-containing protein n=1 Tax=Rhizocola hellebori TaxID=1392758 RepID=A0A8J3VGU8_9ACTN|nr:lantibiotic dehydratase [Rhizocola hellebori]GIH05366.1 hypothetical protein Rhe02_34330 [Rhizocola hellebori]